MICDRWWVEVWARVPCEWPSIQLFWKTFPDRESSLRWAQELRRRPFGPDGLEATDAIVRHGAPPSIYDDDPRDPVDGRPFREWP